jgi:hypothetical protein
VRSPSATTSRTSDALINGASGSATTSPIVAACAASTNARAARDVAKSNRRVTRRRMPHSSTRGRARAFGRTADPVRRSL